MPSSDAVRSGEPCCRERIMQPVLLAGHDLGRGRRVKAMPLRSRYASLDTAATAKGGQLRGGRGRTRAQTYSEPHQIGA